MFKSLSTVILSVLAVVGPASVAHAAGPTSAYLLNASFNQPWGTTVPGDAVTTAPMCGGPEGYPGYSASESWGTWVNASWVNNAPPDPHQITSWIAPDPYGNYTTNLVFTGRGGEGLAQVLSSSPTQSTLIPQGTWTDVNTVGAWVWVVTGSVSIQLGDGGAAGGQWHSSQTTGQWEWIGGCGRADGLNNEVAIYSGGEPAIFYVDDAVVGYDPTCGPI